MQRMPRQELQLGAMTMTIFDNPFDPTRKLKRSGCSCGRHADDAEHARAAGLQVRPAAASEEKSYEGIVASAVMRALFPKDAARRAFLKSVGAATALAAISQFFPLRTATEVFAAGGPLEKTKLKVGFIPITCATPIIMAQPMGFYSKNGLNVDVVKTAGWAIVRDKTINKEYDAAHMLSPMPIAITLGLGSQPIAFTVPAIENINGQGITLAMKHKDNRDPKQWKGFKFAIPFDYSNHNYLLRYYLAEHGIDPDNDVQLRVVPPPEMVANLRADNLDGFLAPDNICQRAIYDGVGFLHILSKEIWDGHPCCAFAASREFITQAPNSYAALIRAIVDATTFASKAENRKDIAAAIAPAAYLNQPETVIEQVLTGVYPLAILRGLDPHSDEALGPDQRRRRLQSRRRAGLPRHRHLEADERDGPRRAVRSLQVIHHHGQDVRSVEARRISAKLQDQEGGVMIQAGIHSLS
jgi:nitrate/nitrite transport system substrate-binding protein